ncbi:DUF6323 family protein [Clostridium sp. MT-14]|jgi:hypothetical protein|uniref:DUF6323 family protein n=1 Tax=unclassified Clostridium TaxID=2614128 RepID=UPI00123A6F79|nr:DUF6323 family protein [Clostridium sp. HV4-5-A1G]KAA8667666.1 hypothetical protein F3O63_15575 [Clostridium sp. HV4-5-A1G]
MNLPKIFDSVSKSKKSNSIDEIFKLNAELSKYNLVLGVEDIKDIINAKNSTLKSQGRIELNLDIIEFIIRKIGKSPYVNQDNLVETINDMYAIFHYVKNCTSDFLPDKQVLEALMFFYGNVYNGSMELVMGKGTEKIINNFRHGKKLTCREEEE